MDERFEHAVAYAEPVEVELGENVVEVVKSAVLRLMTDDPVKWPDQYAAGSFLLSYLTERMQEENCLKL